MLIKASTATNYLENATKTNGLVSWTENIDARTTLNNVNYIDNKSFSVNGGFSWTFGMGNASLGLPPTANPAYVYVKANGLTANTRYDFSFIYQKDFIFVLDSIKDGNNNVLQLETPILLEQLGYHIELRMDT